jgi:hypothetical protein
MRRDVVPRFRIAREGGVRRAAPVGLAPAFRNGAVSAALLPSMKGARGAGAARGGLSRRLPGAPCSTRPQQSVRT